VEQSHQDLYSRELEENAKSAIPVLSV
jgi:hypothetical protein